jgi:hypothetical protein
LGQGSGNTRIQLLFGNIGQPSSFSIGFGQGSRSFITLEGSTGVPNLIRIMK